MYILVHCGLVQPVLQEDWSTKTYACTQYRAFTLELSATVCRSPVPGMGKQHGLRTQSTQLYGG